MKERRKRSKQNQFTISENMVNHSVQNALATDPNIMVHRVNTGAAKTEKRFIRFGTPGQSDFSGIVKTIRCPKCRALTGAGVRLEIECKGPKGRLSEHQKEWLNTIKAMNGIAIVVQPKTMEDLSASNVKKYIDNLIYQPCSNCEEKK